MEDGTAKDAEDRSRSLALRARWQFLVRDREGTSMLNPSDLLIPESVPVELEPIYSASAINQPIKLYEGTLELEQGGGVLKGEGLIQLGWLPKPALFFRLNDYSPKASVKLETAMLRVPHVPDPIEVDVTSAPLFGGFPGMTHSASGLVSDTELGHGDALASVLFHIPNFRDFGGATVRDAARKRERAARASIEADCWRVTIDSIHFENKEFMKELKSAGGFGITHVGKLERTDGQVFPAADAKRLLGDLFCFLSFCRGSWVAPILAVGLDASGNRAWEHWRNWKVERWRRVGSWFNDHSADADGLTGGFAGFLCRVRDATWDEPIRLALHWYVESNMCAGGVEGSIILAQAAFELLAWTLLVEDRKVVSEDGFQKLPASDKMRLMISTCDIPLPIPTSLDKLTDLAKAYNWDDGPQAFTEIRNALVHSNPEKRKRVFGADVAVRYDAWSLGLWYLELVLLRLFEYEGSYSNRLRRNCWRGQEVEKVPWAK